MNVRTVHTGILISTILLSILVSENQSVLAKSMSIDQRQAKLMQEINQGQKNHELTVKEANRLRKELAQVARSKSKMKSKSKSNGKLSPGNNEEIESKLNAISNELHETKLEKRIQPK